jgi:DeoR/GlpR family transcriptional regulator of sugar metabolism
MLTQQRKQFLLKQLARDGRLVAKALSEELSLSEDTIRRDLRELAADGLLQRVHGGALPASPTVARLEVRRGLAPEEKNQLAGAAVKLLEPHQRVFIDGGTTHLRLVAHIPVNLSCTIVTHSPLIAAALEHHSAEVILIGGRLFKHSMVNVGAAATDALHRMHVDLAFIGLTGLHPQEGGTTGDYEEAEIKRVIVSRAAETVALVTLEKIGAVSAHTVCGLTEIASIVVAKTTDTIALEQKGLRVIRAN